MLVILFFISRYLEFCDNEECLLKLIHEKFKDELEKTEILIISGYQDFIEFVSEVQRAFCFCLSRTHTFRSIISRLTQSLCNNIHDQKNLKKILLGMQDFCYTLKNEDFKCCYTEALNSVELDDNFKKIDLELDFAVYSDSFWTYAKLVIIDDFLDHEKFPSLELCDLLERHK